LKISEVGAWSVHNAPPPTGVLLFLFWFGEGVSIVGIALSVSHFRMVENAFCERCELWCQQDEDTVRLVPQPSLDIRQRLEQRDFDSLKKLCAARCDAPSFWRLDLEECPECRMTHTLTVHDITVTIAKNRKRSEGTHTLVKKLLISPAASDVLRGLRSLPFALASPRAPRDQLT